MNRRTLIIAGAAAGVMLLLWYAVLWSPRKAAISEAHERLDKAETLRAELATKLSRLQAARKNEPAKRAQLDALKTTIPDDPNLAGFILDTNDAAVKSGIDWISVAPTAPAMASATGKGAVPTTPTGTAVQAPAEIGLNLQLTGGYFQVLDFLKRLSDMPRLVMTDKVDVHSDADAKLTVSLGGRMFVRTVPPGYGNQPLTTTATTAPAATGTSTPPASTPPTANAAPAATAQSTGARS